MNKQPTATGRKAKNTKTPKHKPTPTPKHNAPKVELASGAKKSRRKVGVPKGDKSTGTLLKKTADHDSTVMSAYNQGKIRCCNPHHFIVRGSGPPRMRPTNEIIELMKPFQDAACNCELYAVSKQRSIPGTYQTEWVNAGGRCKGIGTYDPEWPAKRVMPVPYRLTVDQRNFLMRRFPGWLFVSTKSLGHDHPVANASTRVASFEVQENLPKGTVEKPYRVMDLWGRPRNNLAHNRHHPETFLDTLVYKYTTKDWLRAHSWGPEINDAGERQYWHRELRSLGVGGIAEQGDQPDLASYQMFISVHAAYYARADDIAELMAKASDSRYRAVMHKFPTDVDIGFINNGEQKWERFLKDGEPMIRQTNVLTGESYIHFDNSWLFACTAHCHTRDRAERPDPDDSRPFAMPNARCITWDIQAITDETFIFNFVRTDNTAFNFHVDTGQRVDPLPKLVIGNTREAVMKTRQVVVAFGEDEITWDVDHDAFVLFEDARKRIMGKPRTAKHFQDHLGHLKRDDMRLETRLSSEALRNAAEASFWVDANEEVLRTATCAFAKMRIQYETTRAATGMKVHAPVRAVSGVLDVIEMSLGRKSFSLKKTIADAIHVARDVAQLKNKDIPSVLI